MAELRQRIASDKETPLIIDDDGRKKPKYWNPMTDGVKWVENYAESLETFFTKTPDYVINFFATFAIITFGATLRGEWVVILVTALKQISGHTQPSVNSSSSVLELFTTRNMKMENIGTIFIACQVISFSAYFLLGGFLHWYFYINKRHLAKEWKIQPDKWLTPELEREEIMWGVLSLFCAASLSAYIASYILNGNPSCVYYQLDEYGWWWFFLQFPAQFFYNDYMTYIMHRFYHIPLMYKYFHKVHHKYKHPTVFSVTAVHPVEILHIQLVLWMPLFTVPCHWIPFYCMTVYAYYRGIIIHTGVDFKSYWWMPWQPGAKFHDDHHVFFHCNYGFNLFFWDRIHGTIRKKDRVYTEETFDGQAPSIDSPEAKAILAGNTERAEVYRKLHDPNINNDYYEE